MTDKLLAEARSLLRYWLVGYTAAQLEGGESEDAFRDAHFHAMAQVRFFGDRSGDYRKLPIAEWYDDERAKIVIGHAASGDRYAHDALRTVAAQFHCEARLVPRNLSAFMIRCATMGPPKFKVGARRRFIVRDMAIAITVWSLKRTEGVQPTRNEAERGTDPPTSACALVTEALREEFGVEVSEATVEKVWEKRDKRFFDELDAELTSNFPEPVRKLLETRRNVVRTN